VLARFFRALLAVALTVLTALRFLHSFAGEPATVQLLWVLLRFLVLHFMDDQLGGASSSGTIFLYQQPAALLQFCIVLPAEPATVQLPIWFALFFSGLRFWHDNVGGASSAGTVVFLYY